MIGLKGRSRQLGAVLLIAFGIFAASALFLYSQSIAQTGYLIVTPDAGSPRFISTELFSYSNNGVLVSQAGVDSAEPIRSGRIFVEESDVRTGLALVNPATMNASAVLTLRDAGGSEVGRQPLVLSAGQHLSRFADELFPIPLGFSGSLTFESNSPLAALTLRQNRNSRGESLYATLPIVDLTTASTSTDPVVFPQLAAGGEYTTQIILINRSGSQIRGRIRLIADDGTPLVLQLAENSVSEFPYQIEANGVYRAELGNSNGLSVGYAVAVPESGGAPAGTAIFQFKTAGQIVTEAGVAATSQTTLARIFVDHAGSRTGLAIANPGNAIANLSLTLMDRFGSPEQTAALTIPAAGHKALYVHELFTGLTEGFTGLLEIQSTAPVSPLTLKLTVNTLNETILTTLPVADLMSVRPTTTIVFPQFVLGGGFSTRLIFINSDRNNATSGQIKFYKDDGSAFTLFMGGAQANQFGYRFVPGGARQYLPGNTARAQTITLLDASYQPTTEFTINEGDTGRPHLLIADSDNAYRDDFDVNIISSNSDVASTTADGAIFGKARGFSTLAITAGSAARAFVATVTGIGAGNAGFGVVGVVPNSKDGLYLAATEQHTVLSAESVTEAPTILAGTDRTPGFKNDLRLNSLFNNPVYLAKNGQSLYVSDAANNVIRTIQLGPDGRVETLAGTGVAGGADGPAADATFDNPQGIARDDTGQLWVADSHNHTIRRINLSTGRVDTIAGKAGQAGFADGPGQAARFRTPAGITVEPEPLALQLDRERRRQPPPPVHIIVADAGNNAIRRVYDDGRVETLGGAPPPGALVISPRAQGQTLASLLNSPEDVAADSFGTIYVTEPGARRVRAILPNGDVVAAAGAGTFVQPKGIAVTRTGRVVVTDTRPKEVRYGEPLITSVTPDRVSLRGGTKVTIHGKNFAPGTLIVIAGFQITSINPVESNTETIAFLAPPLPSGRTTLSVQNRGGLAQIAFLIQAVPLGELPAGYITTVAGGSTFAGDGGAATGAPLTPSSVVLDASGNLLVADLFNHRIRRIDALTGIITSVAGNGQYSFSGDGGLAISAALNNPLGTAVDSAGNLFIADADNERVRRVDARTGVISTIAGTGTDGFSGDGGAATAADLNLPSALAIDATGNLFIADTLNNRIRRVDGNGIITTVAGNGRAGFAGDNGPGTSASLSNPTGIAFDGQGRLLIADTSNNRIRRLDKSGVITTVAGNGENGFSVDGTTALAARLANPKAVVADVDGNLFIADTDNCRVRKVTAADSRITTIGGVGECGFYGDEGKATLAALTGPRSLAVDPAGNVYIADQDNLRVRRVDGKTGIISTIAGIGEGAFLGDNGPATSAVINYPLAIAFDAGGTLFIADSDNRVRKVDAGTGFIATVAGGGAPGNIGDGQSATAADLFAPSGIAFDRDGNLYFSDNGHSSVRKVDARTRIISTVAGTGEEGFSGDGGLATKATLSSPRNLAIDGAGNLFIGDDGNLCIRKVNLATGIITTYAGNGRRGFSGDGGQANLATISAAWNFVLDSAGNLYLSDYDNSRIRKVDRSGIITTLAGGDTDNTAILPISLAFDRSGRLYVMDLLRQGILRLEPNGTRTFVAGNQDAGFSGDAGPAVGASLSYPVSLAFDQSGNLFIADSNNNRIRAIRGPIP
jgi:sugar lactone lactonase YvrE